MKHFLMIALAVLSLYSCNKIEKPESVERAFYFWKSDGYINEQETNMLNSQDVQKLYIKFFEIDHNEAMGNFPFSKTSLSYYEREQITFEVIPTIFIKNNVFQKSTDKDLDNLADNTNFLIGKYLNEKFDSLSVQEIQIDCDWTPSTKENYFKFLKKFKKLSQKEISVTLRLYPYKFPDKMGVPPADKAMLMCYNLINPLADKSKNSILDIGELKKYLEGSKKYPLHLDVALPIYSWMQVYKNNQFTGVLYNTSDVKPILNATQPMWYEVKKDTVINYQTYLKVGDKIKYEAVTPDDLEKTIDIIKKNVYLDKTITVSFFHLDEDQLKPYSNEEISSFYTRFTK